MVYFESSKTNKDLGIYKLVCPLCKKVAHLRLFRQDIGGIAVIIPYGHSEYFFTCGNCWQSFRIKKDFARLIENGFIGQNELIIIEGEQEVIVKETQSECLDISGSEEMQRKNIEWISSDKDYLQPKPESKSGIDIDDSSPDSKWLAEFEAINNEAKRIINAVRTVKDEHMVVLDSAIQELPVILQKLKATPAPLRKEYQKYKKDILAGIDLYIKSFRENIGLFRTHVENVDNNATMAYSKFENADKWLQKGGQ